MLRPMSPPITSMIWRGRRARRRRLRSGRSNRRESATSAFRNGKGSSRKRPECQSDQRHADPKQAIGGLLGERSAAHGNALLPAQEWGSCSASRSPSERRRKARAREPRVRMRHEEADTALPGPRWNLISAPLFGVSCRQKIAEQKYYNLFSRFETVPSWFAPSNFSTIIAPVARRCCA